MNKEQLKRLAELRGFQIDKSITDEQIKELNDLQKLEKEVGEQITIGKNQVAQIAKEAADAATKDLQAEVKELKKQSSRKSILGDGEGEGDDEAKSQVAKFFKAWKKNDKDEMKAISAEISKGMSEGTDADGGYMVHPEFHREIFKLVEEYGVARKLFRVLPMGSDSKNISSLTGSVTAAMVGEAGTVADSKQTVGQINLIAKKAMANVIATSELIEDNSTDQEIWTVVAEAIAEAFALLEDDQCFKGAGTGNNHTGLLISTDSAINVVTMATGDTGFADITADYLLDLQDACPESVAKKGEYLMSRSIFNTLRKLKDTEGNYIVQRPTEGRPATIWDRPVNLSDSFPILSGTAVSTKFVAFGDFKKAGVIGDRRTLRLKKLTEGTVNSVNLADTDQDALQATARFAFSVALGDAVALLKTAAS